MSDGGSGQRITTCPACGYERKPREVVPDDVCPSCGVVYWKVAGGGGPPAQATPAAATTPAPTPAATPAASYSAEESSSGSSGVNVKLIVAAVVVGAVLACVVTVVSRRMAEKRTRELWMPLVTSLSDPVAIGTAKIESYGWPYGKMKPVEGKVLVWSIVEEKLDTFGVASSRYASSPGECGTVLFVRLKTVPVGHYRGTGMPALQQYADVFMVNAQSRELVYGTRFVGEEPPWELEPDVQADVTSEERSVKPDVRAWIRECLGN